MPRSSNLQRRRPLRLAAIGLLLSLLHSVDAGEVIDIGDRNQVFIDGRYLESVKNARILVCQPRKTNEKCLVGRLGGYTSIMEPDGRFGGLSAYTKDGIHWRLLSRFAMPEPDDILGLRYGSGATEFVDPKAPPSERYKRIDGMRNLIYASRDGSDWKVLYKNVFPPQACYPHGMDSHNVCYYDTRIDKYVAYVRVNKVYECPPELVPYYERVGMKTHGAKNRYSKRTIGRSVTDELSKFPMPEVVLEPDDKDPIFGVKMMDFYCPQVVQYPYAQDAYFLFNSRYRSYEEWYLSIDMSIYPPGGETGEYHNAGVLDVELGASRDGIAWHRYQRKPWIPLGKPGSFDSLSMYMSRGMYLAGDEIWMYYIGLDDPHTGNKAAQNRYTLSRVVLRKDGFTCVEADYAGGEFTTPPLCFDGETLFLNIETSAIGLARVEIQDERETPLAGYTLDECDRLHTANSIGQVVTWRDGISDVSKLSGQAVRLRFELQFGAKLYAFRFGPSPKEKR